MLPSKMSVNKKLLPIKGHFFLFNAGTAPLVPYLSTYARQLGFSSSTVGLIYIVLPIFGLVAKPLFGIIADRFQIQKSLFILFQIVTIISFAAIYFIPDSGSEVSVDLDCGNGGTVLRSCYNTAEHIDQCKVASLGSQNSTALCKMSCDMTSPKMWQTVCEHWHLPQYCYSNTKSIKYTSYISNVTSKDSCVFITSNNVTLDGFSYKPSCRFGSGYVDINEPCSLNCSNQHLATLIGPNKANMTCLDNTLTYRLCDYDAQDLANVTSEITLGKCQTSCELDPQTPWRLMEICEGWGADAADTCHPKTKDGESFPDSLSFDGIILLSSTLAEHKCVYIQLNHIQMMDGLQYPFCSSKDVYQINTDMFHSTCNITCDNEMVNELFKSASETHKSEETQYTKQFWLFFLLMIISWIGQAVVVTFADAICFNLLGTKISQYGKQRLWGSVGFGIFSLLTGVLIDVFSEGTVKNYTVAFLLMFVFMSGDVIVSCYLKVESTKMSVNILTDVGSVLKSLPTFVFMLWTIAVGLCTGLIWQFLFWHIEDVSGMTCDGADYVKTLQGMVSAIQTFGGEIPFMFVSGYLLRKFGHANTMSLVLFAFGLRFILYSIVTNPWWILPIEMLQGITFGMFYPTMTSYATVVSPPGTETTVQGLVGAVFEGVGTSLGSFIGGRLYDAYGGWNTFQYFGIGAFAACALHMLAQYALGKRNTQVAWNQGNYTPIIKYGQEDDAVYILEDLNESS